MQPELAASMPFELRRRTLVLVALLLAVLVLPLADLEVISASSGAVLRDIGTGFLRPDFSAVENIGRAVWLTLAIAFSGVALGALGGLAMALAWSWRGVRILSLCLRGVHELIWALFISTVTGMVPLAAVIALALAYSGMFAKVFGEILEEADPTPVDSLPDKGRSLSALVYGRLISSLPAFWTYLCYRVECGIRSSAVLGFIGLPTLGFELDTFFKQGQYGAAAAILLMIYGLILSQPLWLKGKLIALYMIASLTYVFTTSDIAYSSFGFRQLLTVDMVPAPLRGADLGDAGVWSAFGAWLGELTREQVLPGTWATLLVSYLAVVLSGLVALLGFPLIVPAIVGRIGQGVWNLVLVILRSTPEYMLVFIGVQIFGPSMLPAILALGLHNGAIIGHLVGRQASNIVPTLRADRPRGVGLFAYELAPRVSPQLLSYIFYRAEIILRESMILGILGIATLGFYVDSAIATLRFDRAVMLVVAMILVTACADAGSRALRRRLRTGGVSVRPIC